MVKFIFGSNASRKRVDKTVETFSNFCYLKNDFNLNLLLYLNYVIFARAKFQVNQPLNNCGTSLKR